MIVAKRHVSMHHYILDYFGFSNEDGDGCMAVFVAFPDIKGMGDTFEEAEADAQVWLNYLGACSGCHLGSTSTADMLLQHFESLIDKNIVLYLM